MELPVLESVKRVMARARLVSVHPERVGAAVSRFGSLLEDGAGWAHPCHFFDGAEETLRWIFVLEVLNHCFWPDADGRVWTVFYKGEHWSGYWGLAASLKRAVEAGVPITDAAYLSTISREDLARILEGEGEGKVEGESQGQGVGGGKDEGEGEIPLFERRLENLREAGAVLLEKYGGDAANLVRSAQGDAVRLAVEVASAFPSFRDEARYAGERVFFWKRAQIFAWDLHAAFEGKGIGALSRTEELTAFADYKLPQVLRELGVVSYARELAQKVDGRVPILAGSPEEVEIRAATVCAVELLKQAFARAGEETSSARIDNWLWRLGQLDDFRKRPYHRCRTIYY
jgi:hypothetical protein